MRRTWILLLLCFISQLAWSQKRPTIGLTLSGGGAKGLAHIGILKAIDSAGLKIDYVTGTSMGAVLGSLYAVGYSGDSIQKICEKVDWDLLLSNQASLPTLYMEEKDEYNKYDIELPWVNNSFKISTGFLEAQELWLKLAELYHPVTDIKDFSKFSIPFRCIATDVGNGEAVVLKEGDIVTAVRASMAIPSVFTAVDYDNKRLVDGGISRNFPASDLKDMGADFIIGSTVAGGLLPPKKVTNALQLLMQIAFFREAEDNKKEVPLCDIYIPFELENYTMGSFGSAKNILEEGIKKGELLYPKFKALADSLNAIYGVPETTATRLPVQDDVTVSAVELNGFHNTTTAYFLNTMNFKLHHAYTSHNLAKMVRKAYGSRYYSRINYQLHPLPDGSYKIIFDVTEQPLTFLKASLHYNRFTGIGLIANITTRNKIFSNSRSMASINLGETFRVKGEHLQYVGRSKKFGFTVKTQLDRFDIMTYEQLLNKQTGIFKQNIFEVAEKIHYSPNTNLTFGVGHRWEWLRYTPRITSNVDFRGGNTFSTYFVYLRHNSLDRVNFPRRGWKLDVEGGRVGGQTANFKIYYNGVEPTNPDSTRIDETPYVRTSLNAEGYVSFSPRVTMFATAQGGINFNYHRNIMNEFIVGGMSKIFRNQITFAGLQEGSIYSPSLLATQIGLRTGIFPGAYITGRANVLFNNFISRSKFFNYQDFYSGYALTFSYNFALGPLDLSVMYCDQTRQVQTYINLGIPF